MKKEKIMLIASLIIMSISSIISVGSVSYLYNGSKVNSLLYSDPSFNTHLIAYDSLGNLGSTSSNNKVSFYYFEIKS